jgi:tetratricopeptide (TPR) repeat protein
MLDKNAIINAAQKFAARGQIDDAIAEWLKLAEVSKDGNIHNTIGDLYLKKGSQNDAVESFSKAADLFRDEGFYPKAIALYKKVLNIVPHKLDARIALAELNAERGFNSQASADLLKIADKLVADSDNEKALEVYEKALRASPLDINIKIKIADLSFELGQKERALKGFGLVASECLEKGDPGMAEKFYQKVIELDPENIASLVGLSNISEKAGNTDQALEFLSKAVSIAPDDRNVLLNYSELAIKADKAEEAQKVLMKLIESDPQDTDVKKLLGALYLKDDQIENAWEEFQPPIDKSIEAENWSEALDLLNNFADIQSIPVRQRFIDVYRGKGDNEVLIIELKGMAALYEKQGSLQEALQSYKELGELIQDDEGIKDKILELENALPAGPSQQEAPAAEETEAQGVDEFIAAGDQEINGAHLKNRGEISPDSFTEKKTEADFYAKQGLKDEAIKIYEELLSASPGNEEIESTLNALKLSAGTEEPSGTGLVGQTTPEEELQKHPTLKTNMNAAMSEILEETGGEAGEGSAETGERDYEACFQAGMNFKREGQLDEAILELQKAAADPENISRNCRMLALCYVEKGSHDRAANEFKKVIETMSSDESGYLDVLYELAEACFNSNDNDNAQKAYNDIYAQDPTFRDVPQKLEVLKARAAGAADTAKSKPKKSRISYL